MAGAARGFLRFWADLVLGDDWTAAATVAAAAAATWILTAAGISAWWLLPVAVVGATYAGLRRAVLGGG